MSKRPVPQAWAVVEEENSEHEVEEEEKKFAFTASPPPHSDEPPLKKHKIDQANLFQFEVAYWKKQREIQEQAEKESKEKEELDGKHAEDEKTDAEWCGWSTCAPLEAKVSFIRSCRSLFSLDTHPNFIAQYLITLEQINAASNVGQAVWELFAPDERRLSEVANGKPKNQIPLDKIITINLSYCTQISHEVVLANTPFGKCTQREFDARITRLQFQNTNNMTWYRHMVATKETRATGRPIAPLIEAPRVDDESQINEDRDGIKEDNNQKLLNFMFQRAGEEGLRRSETSVYAPLKTPEGMNTRFYQLIGELEPWARFQVTPKSTYPAEYHWMTKKGGGAPEYLVKHLSKQYDSRFPFHDMCRTWFSFRNGIYDANENKFYLYETADMPLNENIRTVHDLPENIATANYFDIPLKLEWFTKDESGRFNIPVPKHESIFTSQGFDAKEIDWIEALLGRLQHNVGDKDDWQNTIHIEGPAKTGKSVLLKLLAKWYPAEFIGIIGDNVEDRFPDQHVYKKLIVMCMDLSDEFGLTPTRFLCWCSGDWVEIHIKGKEAVTIKWTAPTIWASNGKPPIAGKAGAAKRRYIIIQMLKAVRKANANLFAEAEKEVGLFLVKCSMAYHAKINLHGKGNLYDDRSILPERFHKASQEYAMASSWVDAYLYDPGRFEFENQRPEQNPLYTTAINEDHFDYVADQKEVDESKKVYKIHLSKFRQDYSHFQQTHKMQGVNKERPPAHVECVQTEFANALNELGCYWDEHNQYIIGLRLNPEKIKQGQQEVNKTNKQKQDKKQQHPAPPPTQPPNTLFTAPPPDIARPVNNGIPKGVVELDAASAAILSQHLEGMRIGE